MKCHVISARQKQCMVTSWIRQMPSGGMVSSTVGFWKFLDGQGGVLIHHLLVLRVKPQIHSSFRADLHVHQHLPCGLVPEQSGCHHCHPYDLIGVNGLLSQDASDNWWWIAFHRLFCPQHLGNFQEPQCGASGIPVEAGAWSLWTMAW